MYDVLLVDDEVIFLEFLQKMIDWEAFDCRICACREDGARALEYITEFEPHIIFLDILMPNKDGLQVCEIIRKMNLPTKVIIMTGHDKFSFAYQAIKLDIDDYLLKPFTVEELNVSLGKIIAKITHERVQTEQKNRLSAIPGPAFQLSKRELLVKEIDMYLNAHYHEEDLSLDKIAAAMQFESSYIRRIYKTIKGFTISQRLDDIRMEKARKLLAGGLYWNKEIAHMVGFTDQYYFSKRFKQVCGCTPTEYRQKGK